MSLLEKNQTSSPSLPPRSSKVKALRRSPFWPIRKHPPLPPNRRSRRTPAERDHPQHFRDPRPPRWLSRGGGYPAGDVRARLQRPRCQYHVRSQRHRRLHDCAGRRARDDPLGQRRQHRHDRVYVGHHRKQGKPFPIPLHRCHNRDPPNVPY